MSSLVTGYTQIVAHQQEQSSALLFISYVHDTPGCIRPKFADDLVSHVSGSDILSVQTELQHNLDELTEWSKKWDMTLNIGKTKAMLFGGKPGDTVILNAGGSSIENVSESRGHPR